MRYGIISDIHGNLEALQAVLEACRQQHVTNILCLGDVVGYGVNPKECLRILKEIKAVIVAGNHDWAVSGKLDASYFPADGKEAISWTRNQLSFEEHEAINRLELVYENKDMIVAHSSVYSPERFAYLTDEEGANQAFEVMKQPICFIGHTHIPRMYVKRADGILNISVLEFELNVGNQCIVNVGSVGQPRDENPMAAYCIYDTDMQLIEFKRIRYDIQLAQKKIIRAGLPEHLAQRLAVGR